MNFTVSYWTSHFIGAAKSVTQPTVGKMKSNVNSNSWVFSIEEEKYSLDLDY
jgi:hypothetical protein